MSGRGKYVEIIKRERGPGNWQALTLEVRFGFCPELARAFSERLPKGSKIWDGDGDGEWHMHPDVLEAVANLAYEHFATVYVTEGEHSVEHRSGRRLPVQNNFFG